MAGAHAKKIPKDDVLEFVVREVLSRRSADSQKELAELINKRFSDTDSSFRVSPERARLAALRSGMNIKIKTREGAMPKICPGCNKRLKKTYMKNLKGRDTILRLRCEHCGYEGKSGKWVPGRYGFSLK
jgi:predicted RNA-binding Zn-ribbon protein involved in translation (DUF1610 family)